LALLHTNIKTLRKRMGVSQGQLGHIVGSNRSNIGAYEEGRANPPLEVLMAMVTYFDTPLEKLLNETINSNAPLLEDFDKDTTAAKSMPNNSTTRQVSIAEKEILFTDKPLAYSFESKNEQIYKANELDKSGGISYISQVNLHHFIASKVNNKPFGNAPKLCLPWLHVTAAVAFEANNEFPIPQSVVIGLAHGSFTASDAGELFIVLAKSGIWYFRRVFDNRKHRQCLLLSSDQSQIPVCELPENEVIALYKYHSYISQSSPKSVELPQKLKSMLSELNQEIDRLSEEF
jgi:transcriptional regulator with XRE-family HTH domain